MIIGGHFLAYQFRCGKVLICPRVRLFYSLMSFEILYNELEICLCEKDFFAVRIV